MRPRFFTALAITACIFFGYAYYTARALCPIPIEYSLGELDPQFALSPEEAKLAITEAASVWEDATGENLFTYNEKAAFTINFVYDQRQAYTNAEITYRDKLDKSKEVNDSISEQYQKLVDSYNTLQAEYSQEAESYQRALAEYNAKVDSYNKQGGAPPEAYAKLNQLSATLDQERRDLNIKSEKLGGLVEQINNLSQEGNKLVDTYNDQVEKYNETFGTSREFTQGTYHADDRIDIYSFTDPIELKRVLAHELGHALSLDHVANENSVMYYLISQHPDQVVLTSEDRSEFVAICGQRTPWATIKLGVKNLRHNIKQNYE